MFSNYGAECPKTYLSDALVPSLDDLALADLEGEGLSAVARAVHLLAVLERQHVVALHLLARLRERGSWKKTISSVGITHAAIELSAKIGKRGLLASNRFLSILQTSFGSVLSARVNFKQNFATIFAIKLTIAFLNSVNLDGHILSVTGH